MCVYILDDHGDEGWIELVTCSWMNSVHTMNELDIDRTRIFFPNDTSTVMVMLD